MEAWWIRRLPWWSQELRQKAYQPERLQKTGLGAGDWGEGKLVRT